MKEIEIKSIILEYDNINDLSPEDQILVKKSKDAAQRAYAPYSKFNVGACIRLENGELIEGNNQENAAYPSGLCAERVALFYANSLHPDVPVKSIAVTVYTKGKYIEHPIPPCGSCRQVLLESERRYNQPIKVILVGEKSIQIIKKVRDLLPLSFDEDMLK
jgi:cytidine deaminase